MTAQPDARDRTFRFAVNVTPRPGILDPQGRAVEQSLSHLDVRGVSEVRVGRRVELSVTAPDESAARRTVERLASELLSNPLIEVFAIERVVPSPDGDASAEPARGRSSVGSSVGSSAEGRTA